MSAAPGVVVGLGGGVGVIDAEKEMVGVIDGVSDSVGVKEGVSDTVGVTEGVGVALCSAPITRKTNLLDAEAATADVKVK